MKCASSTIIFTLLVTAMVAVAGRSASPVEVDTGTRSAADVGSGGGAPAADYAADGRLRFPQRYREWTYLSSGIDMRYTEEGGNPNHSMFDNVFVDTRAYREFLRTGKWIDGTVLVLENRAAAEKGSINRRGRYQTRDVMGVEAHVKDSKRYPDGWAFFAFRDRTPAAAIARSADCYSCHRDHGAVDTTFVQFYPTLLEAALSKGTVAAER